MKTREFAELAIRLTGLVFILIAFSYLLGLILTLVACLNPESRRWAAPQLAVFCPMVVDGLMGIILFRLSKPLSRLITRGLDENATFGFSLEALQSWSIALSGLVIAILPIPKLFQIIARRIVDIQMKVYYSSCWPTDNVEMICFFFQFLLGVAVFLGASGLLGLRKKFRAFGASTTTGKST